MRIISWNIERLTQYLPPLQGELDLGGGSTPARVALRDVFAQWGWPDCVCLQEVRLRERDRAQVKLAQHAVPGYDAVFALCSDALNAKSVGGRLYGVAVYWRAHGVAPSWRTPSWDREGRILIGDFERFTLVNWYGVNGTDRPYYDPTTGHQDGDRHGFKLRSQQALQNTLQPLVGQRELIIIGDINVTPDVIDITPRLRKGAPFLAARRHLNDVFKPSLGLVDIYRHIHPEARQYTWFNRVLTAGRLDAARVDYALFSANLVPHVRAAVIHDDPRWRFHSDHAPIEIDIHTGSDESPTAE